MYLLGRAANLHEAGSHKVLRVKNPKLLMYVSHLRKKKLLSQHQQQRNAVSTQHYTILRSCLSYASKKADTGVSTVAIWSENLAFGV